MNKFISDSRISLHNSDNLCQKSLIHPPPFPRSMLNTAMRANLCSTLQFVNNIERWEREVGLANASEYQQFDKDCNLCQKSLIHPPPFPRSMLNSAMRANLCSTLQFVNNIERWEREVGLANASEYQQFDKDCG